MFKFPQQPITVAFFSVRYEATAKQTGFINRLLEERRISWEEAVEGLFGMHPTAAFSDRPWMRLTLREASALIDRLKAIRPAVAA